MEVMLTDVVKVRDGGDVGTSQYEQAAGQINRFGTNRLGNLQSSSSYFKLQIRSQIPLT